MSKRFKIKFTIPSFQLCRPKDSSTLPANPVPKALYIGYPNLPPPPPPTPQDLHVHCNHQLKIHCEYCINNIDSKDNFKLAQGRKSTSSISSKRSDNQDENEFLISCLTSFSDEFSHEFIDLPRKRESCETEEEICGHREKIRSVNEARRMKFQAWKNLQEGLKSGEMKTKNKTVMTTYAVEGKVRESFAVVKRSKDPYGDFKKSMMEMIVEMEMFEAKELEQLLQCFLTLNSHQYHGVIVRAFMEIWHEIFCQL